MAKDSKLKKNLNSDTPSAKVFWALMYFVLIIVILISACFIYDRTYYTPFYVDGTSMLPTLNKDVQESYYEFGIEDEHPSVIKTIKRYDLIITYYNGDFNDGETPTHHSVDNMPNKKIKRVIGLPNDKITIKNVDNNHNEIWLENEQTREDYENKVISEPSILLDLPFTPTLKFGLAKNIFDNNKAVLKEQYLQTMTPEEAEKKAKVEAGKCNEFTWTLKENEIFAMGDNWGNSRDSSSAGIGPVKYDYISGVVIKIQGYLKIENGIAVDKHYYPEPRYYKQ